MSDRPDWLPPPPPKKRQNRKALVRSLVTVVLYASAAALGIPCLVLIFDVIVDHAKKENAFGSMLLFFGLPSIVLAVLATIARRSL